MVIPMAIIGRQRWVDREPPAATIPPAPETMVKNGPALSSNGR
jgi:hypothetical protein